MTVGGVSTEESGRRRAVLATIFFTVLTLALFDRVLLRGEAFFSRDVAPLFYPMKHFLATSVRAGHIPLWNPWVAGGEPFFASLQPGLLYPGSLVLYALPLPASFDIMVSLHYPLAGMGMALLLRRWDHGWPGALVGGTAFMLGGFLTSIGSFVNNVQTVAWLPWVFLAWDRVLDRRRARDLLLFSLACAVAFLGGEPQLLALGLAVAFAHGLLRVEDRRTGTGMQTASFVAAGVLAMAVVAVQLVPFAEYMSLSVRRLPIDVTYAASRSLDAPSIFHFFVPPALRAGVHGFTTRHLAATSVPWLVSVYLGSVALVLAVLGASACRSRRWILFWGGAAALGVLLALGSHSPLYRFLFAWVPPMRPFRYPEKLLFLTTLAFAVVAAHGTDRWMAIRTDGSTGGRRKTWGAIASVGGLYGLLGLALWFGVDAVEDACSGSLQALLLCEDPRTSLGLYGAITLRLLALVGAFAIVTWLFAAGRVRSRLAAGLLVTIVAADLLAAHRDVNPSVDDRVYEDPPWAARALDGLMADRLAGRYRGTPYAAAMGDIVMVRGAWELTNMYLDYQTMGPNVGQMFGFPMQDGLQGVELISVAMTNEAALNAWSSDPARFLRAMNVRYYADATAAGDTIAGLVPAASHPELPIRIYEVLDPVPRVYLTGRYEVEPRPDRALRRALADGFPLSSAVVVSADPVPAPDSVATGSVLERVDGNGRVNVRVATDGPALVVLSDRHYPGWQATVDGERAPVLLANGVFRAVAVPAGVSDVEFRYTPASVKIGTAISVLGLLVVAGAWARARERVL